MRKVNVNRIIDEAKLKRFHGMLLFWCAFIIVFDGYDLVVYGTVVPVLMEEWALTAAETGTVGSYAFVGAMIGGFLFGTLADKFGRKNVIIFCVALFSLFTALCGLAKGPVDFSIYRFIAGLGLGGVMPNVVALVTEYSPKKLKNTLVSLMFSGYSVGGVISALAGILLISSVGWESLFFIGAIPLLSIPLLYKYLPDSVEFLLVKKKDRQIGQVLAKIDPAFKLDGQIHYETVQAPKTEGMPALDLFKSGRAVSTFMFFIVFFMCLLMVYGLNTWLPKLMAEAGYELGSSIMFLLVLNFGAIFGAIFGGRAADRWSGRKVLMVFFITAAISLTLLGFITNTFVLYVIVAIAGATTIGTQIISYAHVSQFYPTHIRSTGIGWISGVGRLGAIVGPLLGGYLLTMNLSFYQNFLAFALAGVIAALAVGISKNNDESVQAAEMKPAAGER